MTTLYFDIETLPADESSYEKLKYLYDRKKNKKSKSKKEDDEDEHDEEEEGNSKGLEEFIGKTGFDGGFGQILCIAYAIDNGPLEVLCNDKNEKKTLEQFWDIAKGCDLFVGHNVISFDFRFIMQRSIVLGVKPTWQNKDMRSPKYLSFARYRNFPIFDTMSEWVCWGENKNSSLEHVALALDIPTPKDGIDGSEVARVYKEGGIDKICDYCKRDVDVTRRVYKRMVFEN
jgi:DNA polymerase elongation subunit (family B)